MELRRGFLLAVLAVIALQSCTVAGSFGRNLLSNRNELFIAFDGEPLLAQCGDMLVFATRTAVLLKDGLCDPAAAMASPTAAEGELLQFLVPEKSVGRLVFAAGDCAAGAPTQEVNVICDVSFDDAIDSATERTLASIDDAAAAAAAGGDADAGMRGRTLRTLASSHLEHEVEWADPGPYEPIQAQCGDSLVFGWGNNSTSEDEHSLFYLPDLGCPSIGLSAGNWFDQNVTAIMLHELSAEGLYTMQLPMEGEFTMALADSSDDGLACAMGHIVDVIVTCDTPGGNYTIDETDYIKEIAPVIAPEVEPPAPAPAPLADPLSEYLLAPGPQPFDVDESKLRRYRDDEDDDDDDGPPSDEFGYEFEDLPPAPAPKKKERIAPVVLRDRPRAKSADLYDYDYEPAPTPKPSKDDYGSEYEYFYEELEAPPSKDGGPTAAPSVVKRIKRATNARPQDTAVLAKPAPLADIPKAKRFPVYNTP